MVSIYLSVLLEQMLDRLKDKDIINQWYPAVRHQAIL